MRDLANPLDPLPHSDTCVVCGVRETAPGRLSIRCSECVAAYVEHGP